jgi:glycine/D-amino acid oxidase-like deaminating enzyme
MRASSFWTSVTLPEFPPLTEDCDVDVAIVGGGLTGITAAYLLKKTGRRVALLERDRCAHLNTGSTTAHLTCVTDMRLRKLVSLIGRDHAAAVWDAGLAAIQRIHSIVEDERIVCDFAWVPGFLCASIEERKDEAEELRRDALLAAELGFEAEYMSSVPLVHRPGVRFSDQ